MGLPHERPTDGEDGDQSDDGVGYTCKRKGNYGVVCLVRMWPEFPRMRAGNGFVE